MSSAMNVDEMNRAFTGHSDTTMQLGTERARIYVISQVTSEQIKGKFKHIKDRFPSITSRSFLMDVCEVS